MGKGKILVVVSISACVMAAVVVAGAYMTGIFGFETKEPERQPLRVGIIPAEDTLEMWKSFEVLEGYLEKELDVEIKPFIATDYTGVIEAMAAGKIDLAYFGPFSYVLAAKRAGAEAIAAGGTKEGKLATYRSILLAHPGSGIKSIDVLKREAKEIDFAFVDPASTSGYLIPRAALLDKGINPDNDFKEVIFAGGHDAVHLAVKAGHVDVGASSDSTYKRMIKSGAISEDDVVIIWESDPIPPSPWAVRRDLDPELKEKIRDALISAHERDPEVIEAFKGWGMKDAFVKVSDADYEYIRGLAEAMGYI